MIIEVTTKFGLELVNEDEAREDILELYGLIPLRSVFRDNHCLRNQSDGGGGESSCIFE